MDHERIFHLAIPTHDLDESEAFYTEVLGARRARRYHDRITLDFFGHQVVCHLCPEKVDREPAMYPRHFGVTFLDKGEFEAVYASIQESGTPLWEERFVRFGDLPERHEAFFVCDPSNNLVEFKHYDTAKYAF